MDNLEGRIKIYYWPDEFWCWPADLEGSLFGRSDDYSILWVPEEIAYDEEFIGMIIETTLKEQKEKFKG